MLDDNWKTTWRGCVEKIRNFWKARREVRLPSMPGRGCVARHTTREQGMADTALEIGYGLYVRIGV
jgi:hypothetical protein